MNLSKINLIIGLSLTVVATSTFCEDSNFPSLQPWVAKETYARYLEEDPSEQVKLWLLSPRYKFDESHLELVYDIGLGEKWADATLSAVNTGQDYRLDEAYLAVVIKSSLTDEADFSAILDQVGLASTRRTNILLNEWGVKYEAILRGDRTRLIDKYGGIVSKPFQHGILSSLTKEELRQLEQLLLNIQKIGLDELSISLFEYELLILIYFNNKVDLDFVNRLWDEGISRNVDLNESRSYLIRWLGSIQSDAISSWFVRWYEPLLYVPPTPSNRALLDMGYQFMMYKSNDLRIRSFVASKSLGNAGNMNYMIDDLIVVMGQSTHPYDAEIWQAAHNRFQSLYEITHFMLHNVEE